MSDRPMKRHPLWPLMLASLLALAACGKPAPTPEPVRAVKLMTVAPSGYGTTLEYAAEVRPRVESRVGFRVGGKIIERRAEAGRRVKAGELLAQIDPQDFQLAADAARAQVSAATTQRDLAVADLRRYVQLREQNFISGAEIERRETTLKAAEAQLEQAKAQLAAQSNQAGYARLVAPVSGVVTAVEAEVGQVVTAGTPVVRIAQDGPRDAIFSVPEDKVAAIRPGTEVSVRLWSDNGMLPGRVREVSASADPVTRTFQVKVALPAERAPALGSTVYVTPKGVGIAGMPVLKLPTSALRQEGKGTAVWVLDAPTMTVKSQPVRISTVDGNDVVVSEGLQPGMQVVTAGVHVLSPGQKVTVYQERRAGADGAAK